MSDVDTAAPSKTAAPAPGSSWIQRHVLPPAGTPARGSTLLRNLIVTVVVVAVLLLATGRTSDFWDYQIAVIAAYLCAVAGLTVLTGLNGQISLGHSALMATGAYTVAFVITAFTNHNVFAQWTLPVALLAGTVVTALLGLIIGVAAARLRGPYLAGITLAVAVAVPAVTSGYSHLFKGDQGIDIAINPPPAALGESFSNEEWQAWYSIIAAALVMLLLANLVHGGFGRKMRAVRDNEVSAQLAGIHVARTQVITFVLSAACAGLGGGVYAAIADGANPGAYSLTLSLYLLLAIVLGGLGSLIGAVWGAIAIVVLPYATTQLMSDESLKLQGNVPTAIFGVLLIVIAIAVPGGLQGLLRKAGRALRRRSTASTEPSSPTPNTTS
ncbi:MAG TPA: branched-chain amino acid ABC transporter permease [Micromonosporaceae bacterium]|jgi:branched-chain amino acid transport system permease protein